MTNDTGWRTWVIGALGTVCVFLLGAFVYEFNTGRNHVSDDVTEALECCSACKADVVSAKRELAAELKEQKAEFFAMKIEFVELRMELRQNDAVTGSAVRSMDQIANAIRSGRLIAGEATQPPGG